jgi:hypothetical protein
MSDKMSSRAGENAGSLGQLAARCVNSNFGGDRPIVGMNFDGRLDTIDFYSSNNIPGAYFDE